MHEITAENAAAYLRETARVPRDRDVRVHELSGGVSNIVLRVDVAGQAPFVLKQSRARLRTRAEWYSRLDRIWIERAAMNLLEPMLPKGTVPQILFDDPDNYLFVMTCAPGDAVVWKTQLLSGVVEPETARGAGTLLGAIHTETAGHPELAGRLADTEVFDQLRIDPYYRRVALVHPDLGPAIGALIASMADAPAPRRLVHGDFSPKNMLVHASGLTLLDFEVAHAGDPAFDLGFFSSHLLLKAFRAAGPSAFAGVAMEPYLELTRVFWAAYQAEAGDDARLVGRSIRHAAACVLARLDGKSPVEYTAELDQDRVRRFARRALRLDTAGWDDILQLVVQ